MRKNDKKNKLLSKTGLEEWFPYSDNQLLEVIAELSKEVPDFGTVNLTYAWVDDNIVILWVVITQANCDYRDWSGTDRIVWVNRYNLCEDLPDDIQKESHRIKRMLKRKLPHIKGYSHLHLK